MCKARATDVVLRRELPDKWEVLPTWTWTLVWADGRGEVFCRASRGKKGLSRRPSTLHRRLVLPLSVYLRVQVFLTLPEGSYYYIDIFIISSMSRCQNTVNTVHDDL